MAKTTADILIETLIEWGVEFVFGMPGDGINGIMEALRKQKEKIRFIQVRHEEAAAFMAVGYAKYTGKLGVCLATSGPGGIHLLNGLYDAKLDGQPVLAITGHYYHDLIGTSGQQDVDLDRLFMDVAIYNVRVMGAAHIRNIAGQACREALAKQGVAHITIPADTQSIELDEDEPSPRNVRPHTEPGYTPRAELPPESALRTAAERLNAGERVAILAGRGALHATDELEAVAEKLGAPVIKALLGKACLPDDSPYTTGTIGLLGTAPSEEAMANCDTLFIVGSNFPYLEYYPQIGQAQGIQIDTDASNIGRRYPVEVGLVGDARATLQALLPLLTYHDNRGFLSEAQEGMKEWQKLMEERGTVREVPMKPQVVAWELNKRLSDNAIVSADSGTITTWWARHIQVKRGQMHSVSGRLASMACALPYALAAQLAYPGRQSVAIVGDGGFSMLMAEFATAVKYDLPVKVILVKNNSLGMIKWEQMVFLGNPDYGVELQPINYALVAEACGGKGFTVEDPADCGRVLDEAFAYNGPALVEAVVDPYAPPMPAKIKAHQAKNFAEALARGEPNRMDIALTIAKDKLREIL